MYPFNRVGGIVIAISWIFTVICLICFFSINITFWLAVKVFLFWLFGLFLFRLGYLLSIKIYASKIVKKLKKVSNFEEEVSVIVIDSPILNAFAFRDKLIKGKRYIMITSGIANLCTKEELNFVIAHEFAHHKENHFLTTIISKLAFPALISIVSIFTSSVVTAAITMPVMAISSFILRRQEYEADKIGCELLRKAGINYNAISFFKKLEKILGKNESKMNKVIEFFVADHPSLQKRIEKLSRLKF